MHKEKNLTYYGEWTEKKLFSFIKDHTSNFFIKLDKDKWNYLFNEKNNSFLLMLIADQSTHDVELEIFHLAARNVSSKLISTYYSISQNQEFSKYLYNFLPALESQIPLIFLIDRMKNETINILMKDEIVYDNIIKFTNNWWRNYFKEEDKSEDRQGFNELIDILNETNFKKKVNDNKKDFIVLFFSNKVKNIRDAKQKFNQYAIMFKNNKNLSFAVINIEENKIEGHKSESSEKIYFFGKKNKKKEILYENDLENEYKFISFVKKNTAYEWIEVETNTKAKDDL